MTCLMKGDTSLTKNGKIGNFKEFLKGTWEVPKFLLGFWELPRFPKGI